jgi:hypothetical protein
MRAREIRSATKSLLNFIAHGPMRSTPPRNAIRKAAPISRMPRNPRSKVTTETMASPTNPSPMASRTKNPGPDVRVIQEFMVASSTSRQTTAIPPTKRATGTVYPDTSSVPLATKKIATPANTDPMAAVWIRSLRRRSDEAWYCPVGVASGMNRHKMA